MSWKLATLQSKFKTILDLWDYHYSQDTYLVPLPPKKLPHACLQSIPSAQPGPM
jgi:hypothetical protein